MRRIGLTAVIAGLVACGGEAPPELSTDELAGTRGSGSGTACVLHTRLSPENEVRTASNTNDLTVESTATGHAQVKVRNDGTLEIKVFILNQDAETFTAGHIHVGPPTANGPVVVPLFAGSTTDTHLVQHEVVAVPPEFDPFELCEAPDEYYVNYHTTQDPVGATRGQLE